MLGAAGDIVLDRDAIVLNNLPLLRLIKAVFTFEGGVDYALWKIERHSGVTVTVSDRARRHPLIFGWGPLFRLWRRGAFR